MTPPAIDSQLAREALEAPEAARRQTAANAGLLADLGARLRRSPPPFVVTGARGSSDHAASYGAFALESRLGRAVASVAPGVASVYGRDLAVKDALFLAVSQSGQSTDLLRLAESMRRGGALTVALVNDAQSPLARLCDVTVPLWAGEERAVAATKSFLLSALALLDLAAQWGQDAEAAAAVRTAPDVLAAALELDWSGALAPLAGARGLYVLGRGAGLGAAGEAALKFKETCGLHAEAFSAAEVIHGPLALAGPDLPVLALGQNDAAAPGVVEAAARMASYGSPVWSTLPVPGAKRLPGVAGIHPLLEPLAAVASLYRALPGIARARGRDPDAPAHLRKVTRTV